MDRPVTQRPELVDARIGHKGKVVYHVALSAYADRCRANAPP